MKRLLTSVIAVAFLFTLVGCGDDTAKPKAAGTGTTVAPKASTGGAAPAPAGDKK